MAKAEEISYSGKNKKEDGTEYEFSGQVTFSMPETVEEAVTMWGEDVCLSKILASVTIDVQRVCRAAEEAEKAQEAVSKYVPGVSRRGSGGGSSVTAIAKKLKELDPEKLKELLEMAGVA